MVGGKGSSFPSLAQPGAGTVPLVLVVDDEADARELYAFYLRYAGMRAEMAVDGSDAIVKAGTLLPDVIVMDLMMPGITGIEAIERLKADASTRSVRIIALTASHEPNARRDALAAGCESFMTKPCPPAHLAAEIRRVLGR